MNRIKTITWTFLAALALSWGPLAHAAAVHDRFVYIDANGINQTLNYAITHGLIGGSPTWYQEAPSGSCNGSNVTFTAAHTPSSSLAVELSEDGVVQRNGVDFTVSSATITLGAACASGQTIWIKYN